MPYQLTKEEQKQITAIEGSSYMKPIIELLTQQIAQWPDKKVAWENTFNKLHELLVTVKLLGGMANDSYYEN